MNEVELRDLESQDLRPAARRLKSVKFALYKVRERTMWPVGVKIFAQIISVFILQGKRVPGITGSEASC